MIPESTLQRVLDSVSMTQVVSSYVTLEQRGGRYWGCCPFHNEKTPSFSVTEDKNLYYCFGCHKGGSLFNFIMEIEGVSFIEAVKLVAEKGGVEIEENQQENDAEFKLKQALRELYRRVSSSFEYILHETDEGKNALTYLKERNIDIETIRKFHIGFSPSDTHWMHNFLKSKGYSDEFLKNCGLFSKRHPKYPLFAGRLMIPIHSLRGEVIAFGGRILQGEGPKYINSPETPIYSKRNILFAMDAAAQEIRKQKNFFICEGYFDVIALHQSGMCNAVAPLGTALTPEQLRLIKRYSTSGCLLFDNDDAGIQASYKSLVLSEQLNVQLQVIPLISGKDPAEIVEKEGRDALHKLLKYPINSFDYLINTSMDKMDISTPEGKESVVKKLLPYIHSVDSPIRRDEYKKVLSEHLDISESILHEELMIKKRGTQPITKADPVKETVFDMHTPEIFMLTGLLSKPELFKEVRRFLTLEEIVSDIGKTIFIALEDSFRRDHVTFDSIMSYIDDDSVRSKILERISSGEFSQNTEALVKDAMLKVKSDALHRQRAKIEKKLIKSTDNDEMKELLSEKMYLDGELDKLRLRRNDRS